MNSGVIISHIIVYPIKSLAGIFVSKWWASERGFRYDRRWLIIDNQNRFVSQREYPHMTLIQPSFVEEGILLTHKTRPELGSICIPYEIQNAENVMVTVWDDEIEAQKTNAIFNNWLSEAVGSQVQLVYMPESAERLIDQDYAPFDSHVSFADGYPYLLIGQASLDDLNTRLNAPVEMRRFRPNLVVEGTLPYAEDQWYEFKIGNLKLLGVKPCARCIMTTINPTTAIKESGEPLRTLSTYRKINNKIFFGQNVMLEKQEEGFVSVGDEIIVVSTKNRRTSI